MCVAGFFESGGGFFLQQVLLALELRAAADLAALTQQLPTAEQVGLQGELDLAGGFTRAGALLE